MIGRERHRYLWRSALVAVAATVVMFASRAHPPWWLSRSILVLVIAADAGLFWWAHRCIARVKSAEGWFVGRRQAVAVDTSWRTDREWFPVVWLLPAVAVVVATAVVGVLRYPNRPASPQR